MWLALLQYLLYCSSLKLSLQYLWGLPIYVHSYYKSYLGETFSFSFLPNINKNSYSTVYSHLENRRDTHLNVTLILQSGKTKRSSILLFKMYLFIYFWLCWIFIAGQAFLYWQLAGGTLKLQCVGFSLSGFSCCRVRALGHAGFSSCGTWGQ